VLLLKITRGLFSTYIRPILQLSCPCNLIMIVRSMFPCYTLPYTAIGSVNVTRETPNTPY